MLKRRALKYVGTCAVTAVVALTCGCAPSQPATPPPPAPELWGEMKPVVSVKELMGDFIDPIADNIFNAISTEVTAAGVVDKVPTTEEDWEKIRIGATALAEGAYLLKVPRPFAPPGDLNDSVGANAAELSPDEILAKVKKDPVEWNARIEALRNVGLEVLDIVKNKRTSELWDASDNLDTACEACHRSYWYPKETPEFYQRLDRRLRDHEQKLSTGGAGEGKP